MFSGFAAVVIGLGVAGYNQVTLEKPDLIREYHSAQQAANTLRSVEIDNPQYLDGIVSGIETSVNKIETERSEEISAYNETVERKKDNSIKGFYAVLCGMVFAGFCAGLTEYTNRRETRLISRRVELERKNRESHPVEAYMV